MVEKNIGENKEKKPNKGGRPKKTLDNPVFTGWEQLDAMIVWANQEYCAEKLGMSIDTLAHIIKERTGLSFPEYKHQKQEPMRINLLKKQYDIAMSGNVTMCIWLGKQYLGQSEKVQTRNEHISPDGSFKVSLSKEEKLEMIEKYKKSLEEDQ